MKMGDAKWKHALGRLHIWATTEPRCHEAVATDERIADALERIAAAMEKQVSIQERIAEALERIAARQGLTVHEML